MEGVKGIKRFSVHFNFHKSATVLNVMTNMLLALAPNNFEISITTFNSPIVSNGMVSGRESV